MATEYTLSIVKPDITQKNKIGLVLAEIEAAGLEIVVQKMIQMDQNQAQGFYQEHAGRPFFSELVEFMCSQRVVVQVLKADNAIEKYRTVMGDTNKDTAKPGTIRAKFATDIMRNCVHGSDSQDSAAREIAFFFAADELLS